MNIILQIEASNQRFFYSNFEKKIYFRGETTGSKQNVDKFYFISKELKMLGYHNFS